MYSQDLHSRFVVVLSQLSDCSSVAPVGCMKENVKSSSYTYREAVADDSWMSQQPHVGLLMLPMRCTSCPFGCPFLQYYKYNFRTKPMVSNAYQLNAAGYVRSLKKHMAARHSYQVMAAPALSARSDDSGNDAVTTPDKGEGLLTAITASSSHSDSEQAVKVCQVLLVCCVMTSCSNASRVFCDLNVSLLTIIIFCTFCVTCLQKQRLHTSLGILACSALYMKHSRLYLAANAVTLWLPASG